jgi:ppGpp synthetase/RelA/SpoT-type nucleotidyltranferase
MPFPSDLIPQAVDRYRRERDRYVKLADRVAEICRSDICDQNAIRAQVTFRVKSLKSLEGKLRRYSTRDDRNYKSVDEIFSAIVDPPGVGDLAGVRIAAYQHEDCGKLVEHLKDYFRGPVREILIDEKDRHLQDRRNFYRAIHAQVWLPEEELVGIYDNIADISCEVQICTMIAHVWNEVEHDIGYKPELGPPSDEEVKLIEMLGHTVRLGDHQISMLLAANARRVNRKPEPTEPDPRTVPFRDVHDFVGRTHDYEKQAMPDFAKNSGQLFDLLEKLDLNTPLTLGKALEPFEPSKLREETEKFIEFLAEKDLSELFPNEASSDLMLLRLFSDRLDKIIELHKDKVGRGRGRPTRLYRLARQYREYTKATSS